MKNYIGFYIILVLLICVLILSSIQFHRAESFLLTKAYALKESDNIHYSYEQFISEFNKMENNLMMLVNHSQYKEICRCIIRLEHNIEYGDDRNIEIDVDELIFLIEEIIEGEKCTLNNIF